MLIPVSWLKKYVPVSASPAELAYRLTMAGTEIGGIDVIGANWEHDKILVGCVLEIAPHPNADRLTLPTLDLGDGEKVTVVCGAPNIAVGQKIAFAREGAMLLSNKSGNIEPLKKAKIRDIVSSGMVCSERELGLGENHEGILVLDNDVQIGTPLVDLLGDAILDADVTPNRPDCLSVLGIAREIGAITGAQVSEPETSYPEIGKKISDRVTVEIQDTDLCGRYTAGLVDDIKVGPSPEWLRELLIKSGQRPINNVVDITNFVMLEYGQPMHAFDFDKLDDNRIIVRQARKKENIATLDDETHDLIPPMLVIANSSCPVAIAGVVGGVATSVDENTVSVLLESANFNSTNTHRTKRAIGVATESSYRFERGIRDDLAPRALKRAVALLVEIAGGTAATGIIDVFPDPEPVRQVNVTKTRVKQVLGIDISMSQIQEVLESLGFEMCDSDKDKLLMQVPYWRSDVKIEDDVIEEIARIIGYEEIPTSVISAPIPHHAPRPFEELREQVRDALANAGMQEVITYSLTNREMLDRIGVLEGIPEPLQLTNPMSRDLQVLRTSLRAGMFRTLETNLRMSRGEGLRLFEIGRIFIPREQDLPDEKQVVVGAFSGPRFPASWLVDPHNLDFFDAKGALEVLFAHIGVDAIYEPSEDSIMLPGSIAQLLVGDRPVGLVGEVHPAVLEGFDISDTTVAMFEIDLRTLFEVSGQKTIGYFPTNRYPESERDIAITVDENIPSTQIQKIIDRHKLAKESQPFDLYTGVGVPAGKKSITYRVIFQSEKATLTSEIIDRAQGDILRQLERELGAELRTQ